MSARERILKVVTQEFPGARVIFSDDPGEMIRFKILDASGYPISKGYQHYDPAETERWSDARIREVIRLLCGLPNV